MTVPAASRKIYFPNINGSTGPFSFNFRIVIEDDGEPNITVTKINGTTRTVLDYLTGYTFTAVAFGLGGGVVTINVAGVSGDSLFIEGTTPVDQLVRYANQGSFAPETHEFSYDKLTMVLQEQVEKLAQAMTLNPESTAETPTWEDPEDAKVPIFDAASNQYINGPSAADIENAEANGVIATNAANLAVQAAIAAAASANGMKYRQARAASTANVNTASAPSSLDGVTLVSLDRILLKNQSTASQNGLYQFNGAGSALTRTTDMDAWTEVPGTVVVVTEGTVNADKVFLCTSNDGGTLGSTAITFIDWASVIFDNTITNAKLATMPANTVKGIGGGGGTPVDLTTTQLTTLVESFVGDSGSGGLKGAVPAPSSGDAAANKFLKSSGGWSAVTTAATAQAASGSAIDFTSIPAGVKRIDVIFNAISLNGTDDILVQLGDSGGVETSGYGSSAEYSTITSTSSSGFVLKMNTAAENHSGVLTIYKIDGTSWVASGVFRPTGGSGTSGVAVGTKSLSAELDRVRITRTGSNTFDNGSVNIFYQ